MTLSPTALHGLGFRLKVNPHVRFACERCPWESSPLAALGADEVDAIVREALAHDKAEHGAR